MLPFLLRTRVLAAGLFAFLSVIGLQSQAPPILPADPLVVAGTGLGSGQLTVRQADGTPVVTVAPFGSGFTGGVRVAAGDIDADGVTDVVAAMASNGGQVRALSGADGSSLGSITPFGPAFSGGVFVAMGDVNADGHDDILLGAGAGGLAQLIDGATRTVIGTGRPFPLPYNAGVTVAMGDVNADGRAELIFGTTLGGFVRVLDFPALSPLASGFPYGPLFTGGVNIAAGDVNGDGVDEIAVAPRNAGGPVRIYTVSGELVIDGTPFSGVQGVNLAMGDLNGDGLDDLVTGAGAGATPRVRAFSILDRTQLFDDLAFTASFRGGVWVATPRGSSTRFTNAASTTFTAGAAGTFAVTTQNGSDTTLSVGGTLPAGVTFTDNGNGTGTLAGTPAAGSGNSYALTFVATRDGRQVAQQPFLLLVQEGSAITSASAATFAIGSGNSFTVATSGAPAAATITATGLLPTGVTFTNNANGTATLAGSPAPGSEGTYPITIAASNGIGTPATQTFTLTIVAGSTPLFTSADATTSTVGAVGSFLVTTSATPVAGTITVSGALPSGVTFTNHGNGTASLTGLPAAGTAGTYPLTITADNGVTSATQTFTLTVEPVAGGAPSFTSGNTVTFAVDTAGAFTVTTTGSPVATTLTSTGALPTGVTFTNNGDGTATLAGTAAAGSAGNYPLTLTADNGTGTATQLFTLTINNISSSPVFTSGATTAFVIGTSETFAITTAASPAVTGITITGALPTGVTFTDNGDGTASLDGTPQAGTGGAYPLTFTATNGGAPVDQAFTLSVQETAAITSASARAFILGVADSFTVTTDGLPVSSVALTGALPTGVTYTDNGDGTGTIAGTAAAGTVGSYPLTLTATNGVGAPGTQAFTLAVTQNTPPTLDVIADPTAILEDAALQTVNLAGISAGVGDTQPLGVTATSSDPTIVPDPTVTYSTPDATGTLQYTPVPNASGSVVITVQVSDGGLDNDLGTLGDNGVTTRTFTVAVTSVNDVPTLDAIADPAAIDEDATQQTVNLTGISTGGGETQPLQVTATSGNTALIPDPTVTYVSPGATGSLAYTPVAGESGTATITVTVMDGGLDNDLGTPGDNLTATDAFVVTVNDVDDAPTLDAIVDPAGINEDAAQQTVNLSGISAGAGETAPLIVTALSNNPGVIPNPTVTYTSPNATGSLSYTPVANASGTAIITVTVSDGGATPTPRTFTVVVNGVNDAPTFTPGVNQLITEDAPAQTLNTFLGTVSAGPNEAGQIVTVAITNVTTPGLFSVGPAISAAGVLTYTPAPEQFGTATISYTVSDNGGTANGGVDSVGPLTFDITITAVNDLPTLNAIADPAAILEDATQQTINLSGIGTGSAAENLQPLAVTAVSSAPAVIPNPTPVYVSPNATGSLTYTPVANAFGTAVITVTVTDGGLDNDLVSTGDNGTFVRTFTVSVTPVNDAPSFTKGVDQTVNEDAGAQTVNPWAPAVSAGPGEGAQTVQFEITDNTNASLFASGPSVSSAGVLSYTPAANQNGSATITLRITDDGGTANGGVNASAPQTFVITVSPVNDAPVVTNKNFGAQANMAITGLSGLLTGVTDADSGVNGCTPTFSVTNVSATNPVGGNITNLNATAGTFDFNPPAGAVGNVTFTYTVTDTGCPGTATSAAATVTINVLGPAIWFVDDSAVAGGDGRLTSPFNTLAGAAAVDQAGHVIFLYSGNYSTGIALLTTESLIGQGAVAPSFDLLMGIIPPAGTVARPTVGGARPTIAATSGTAVTLASGNVVHGLNVSNTNGSGIVGSAVGTLTLAHFDVTVTGGSALSLSGGGTVSGVGADNDLSATTGGALNVNGVNIGATGLTFKSVSASGAAKGISLQSVSSAGTFAITGTDGGDAGTIADAGTGGTITNITGRGAELNNVSGAVSLNGINFSNAGSTDGTASTQCDAPNTGNPTLCNAAIHLVNVGSSGSVALNGISVNGGSQLGILASSVTNLTMNLVEVENAGTDTHESGAMLQNLTGTGGIANSHFHNNAARQLYMVNTTGTLTSFTITGSTFENTFGPNGLQGLQIEAFNAGTNMTVHTGVAGNGNTFNNTFNMGWMAQANQNATVTASLIDATVTNTNGITIQASSGGHLNTDIRNSSFRTGANSVSGAMAVKTDGGGSMVANIIGNTIGLDGVPLSGSVCSSCTGMFINPRGTGSSDLTIIGNTIQNVNGPGIYINSGEALTQAFDAVITGNLIRQPGLQASLEQWAMYIRNGVGPPDAGCMALTLGGTVTPAAWPSQTADAKNQILGVWNSSFGNTEIRVRRSDDTSVNLPGLTGTPAAWITARNVFDGTFVIGIEDGGTPFGSLATCNP